MEDYFDNVTLNESEVVEMKRKEFLPENMETLLSYQKSDGWWYPKWDESGLDAYGVKYIVPHKITSTNIYTDDVYMFTDLFLIIADGITAVSEPYDLRTYKDPAGGYKIRCSRPLHYRVIPLQKIESAKYIYFNSDAECTIYKFTIKIKGGKKTKQIVDTFGAEPLYERLVQQINESIVSCISFANSDLTDSEKAAIIAGEILVAKKRIKKDTILGRIVIAAGLIIMFSIIYLMGSL